MARTTNGEKVRSAARPTREAESRAANVIHEEHDQPWTRGGSLDMPPARPGQDQRWIRIEINGKPDQSNWARKQREGWKPRAADTVGDFPVPKIEQGKHAGYIGIEGMILCERPMSISQRRTRHFRNMTNMRTEAIHADLERTNKQNANPAFGPIRMAEKSETRYEVSRDPVVQED